MTPPPPRCTSPRRWFSSSRRHWKMPRSICRAALFTRRWMARSFHAMWTSARPWLRACRRRRCLSSPMISPRCRLTPTSPRRTSAAWKKGRFVTFTVDAFPGSQVQRQGQADPQLAHHGAKCRHLRHGHRSQQSRFETQAGHDRKRLHHYRPTFRRVENPQRRPSFQIAGAVHQPDVRRAAAGKNRFGKGNETRRNQCRTGREERRYE